MQTLHISFIIKCLLVESKKAWVCWKGPTHFHKTVTHGFTSRENVSLSVIETAIETYTHTHSPVLSVWSVLLESCFQRLLMSVARGMCVQLLLSLGCHQCVSVQQTCSTLRVSWHSIKLVTLVTESKGFLAVSRTSLLPAGRKRWTQEICLVRLFQKFSLL